MPRVTIIGRRRLKGKVRCEGAKNAALPIMAASILAQSKLNIANVPRLSDVQVMTDILRSIGARVRFFGNTVEIDPSRIDMRSIPYELARRMRASFLILGPLLQKMKEVYIPLPGGCEIGQRPVDLHLKALQSMGARINMERGYIHAAALELHGTSIYLDVPSVGATENILMAASLARGESVIENAAQEPEVVDLANFLVSMGADIRGAGTSRIRVNGVKSLHGTNYEIIPDRIEAATFLVAGVITGGRIIVENVIPGHLRSIIAKLKECGATVLESNRTLEVQMSGRPLPLHIKTQPYPGFPTDIQAPFMSLACVAQGTGIITETVFENRFRHAEELRRMGARIRIQGPNAIIEGIPFLTGASVQASDLRAGAALCIAALAAEGTSEVSGMEHVERGYSGFITKLTSLGAHAEWEQTGLGVSGNFETMA